MLRLLVALACAPVMTGVACAETLPALSTAAPTRAPSSAPTLTAAEMSAENGGSAVTVDVLTRQQLTATTSGNTINTGSLSSGGVSFSQDALNGFSGVGNFVINTGANNTLQGAINISVVTAPNP